MTRTGLGSDSRSNRFDRPVRSGPQNTGSNKECGRPETRVNEFRRCSGCGKVNYCSRLCQAYDWRLHHKEECVPMDQWMDHAIDEVEEEVNTNVEDYVMDNRTVEIGEGEVDGIGI